jgi:hypothetical protein
LIISKGLNTIGEVNEDDIIEFGNDSNSDDKEIDIDNI